MVDAPKDEIVIGCTRREGDTLKLGRFVTDVIGLVACDGDARACIDLDAAGARELFNWLGVQLHKGGLK